MMMCFDIFALQTLRQTLRPLVLRFLFTPKGKTYIYFWSLCVFVLFMFILFLSFSFCVAFVSYI